MTSCFTDSSFLATGIAAWGTVGLSFVDAGALSLVVAASTADFSTFGLLATEVVAKPRAGLPAGFFFLAIVDGNVWVQILFDR